MWWHVVLAGIAHVSKAYLIPPWQPGLESVSKTKEIHVLKIHRVFAKSETSWERG